MSTPANDVTSKDGILFVVIIATTFFALLTGLYVSGAANDLFDYVAVKFFKAKAKAEEKALEQAGEGKAEGFLKGQLKKNPVVSDDELNSIQGGLGDEARQQFGKGGFAGGIGKKFE